LRRVFGDAADQIVIANTKGFTGHAMGAGMEDVLAVKSLETGVVPPVANFKEVDPELGTLNLSKGGIYPVEYALRLGAGFGSQISMSLLHWVATKDCARPRPSALGYAYRITDIETWNGWLSEIAGHPKAEPEVVHRTLRVRDQGVLSRLAEETKKFEPVRAPELPERRLPAVEIAAGPIPLAAVPSKEKSQLSELPPHESVPLTPSTPVAENDPVKARVLTLVSEKTGYPVDMLDLDLDLEADLGVDTVKQAEVMATIREAYGIARDDRIKLRDFPTLAHVIRFVHERKPELVTAQSTPPPVAEPPFSGAKEEQESKVTPLILTPQPSESESDAVKERILGLMVEKTGYPRDMLDLDLDLEADLGVDTVKQAEMFAAIREIYNIPRDENRKLRDYPTLAHVIRFVYEKRPDLASATASPTLVEVLASPMPLPVEAPAPGLAPTVSTHDPIKKKVLEIVAEKTGYPEDMLDLDLDLEADLGVDTVKQAEMFAAVRSAYNIPRDESLKLRDFPTLTHVIKFAHDRAVVSVAPSAQKEQAEVRPNESGSLPTKQPDRPVLISMDAANRIPRRVPVPTLRPPLDFCKTTGANVGPNSRVVLMPDKGGVAEALTERLKTLGVEVLRLDPTSDAAALTQHLKDWVSAGRVDGVYWLPALDKEADLNKLDLAAWQSALRVRVKSLYDTMRTLHEHIAKANPFLVSATRLGGRHGYDEAGAFAPLGGAVVGFTKAYKRERMGSLVKAIDFETKRNADEIARLLIDEALRDTGAVEIGYTADQRWTIALQEQPAIDGQPGMILNEKSVFVITGAAGSIVSAITADLAAASGGTFYLLDLVPEPDPKNSDVKLFITDKESLKRELFERIQRRGERATPALVEKELAILERAQAAQAAIDAVHAAGGMPYYFSVNVTDAEAVARVIEQVRNKHGRIDVLLHAAGIERSHSLTDKNQQEFDLVFDIKSDGFFNLLHAIDDMPLGASVVFSSIAGRFGNGGQTDYSAANDLLCKITSNFRTSRPKTRGIAIDWTAWGGIGMATRGSIPKVMESAGIDMLAPEAGIPLIRRELTAGATRGEIVVAQRLGVLLQEFDKDGGLGNSAAEVLRNGSREIGPMAGKIASMTLYEGHSVETTLDPKAQPFLHDHQIEGTPVLPGVMGVEAFAEAALSALPGWHVQSIEDITFLAPFKFYRSIPRVVRIETQIHPHGDHLLAECQLIGERALANQADSKRVTHFTGRVMLAKTPAQVPSAKGLVERSGSTIEATDIYQVYFHGPAYQVLEKAWWNGKQIVGLLAEGLPPNHHPTELPTVMAPRLIELCFQTAGVWELGLQGRLALPQHVGRIMLFCPPDLTEGRLFAVVTPNVAEQTFEAEVLDDKGNCYLTLSGYQTVALPNFVDAERLTNLQAILSGEAVAA
jgi:NAD(P)-dependent dehydrogenase (short-subunit alcohol dehydrogenase family)/acyl carrier protein